MRRLVLRPVYRKAGKLSSPPGFCVNDESFTITVCPSIRLLVYPTVMISAQVEQLLFGPSDAQYTIGLVPSHWF
jgi:hypothetical protein